MKRICCGLILLTVLSGAGVGYGQWRTLEEGLDLARFDSGLREENPDGDLLVLRVDTAHWCLRAFRPEESDGYKGRTGQRWCELGGLVAAVNAGMFQSDKTTHVGFFKINGVVINSFRNDYLSAVAFGPIDPAEPYFHIFDLDEISLGEVAARYHNVVQNLRLIKRAGENRWQPASDRWQEAALGEDYNGRALLIFCDRRWSMNEFNEILLSLPLGLVAAQHLEGRVQASLWINHPAVDGADLPGGGKSKAVMPNILGVTKRHPQPEKSTEEPAE
jgi:Phosphodiester glycosidase